MSEVAKDRPSFRASAFLLGALYLLSSCSPSQFVVNKAGKLLRGSGGVYASDEDPELVRQALPFGLKTMEALIVKAPENTDLLLAACTGFSQYSYAFVETDAFLMEPGSYREAQELRQRALKLYLRARDYCLRALEVKYPGIGQRLKTEPRQAVEVLGEEDVELTFWTGASWASAIALGLDRPELVADVPVLRALLGRALELDEDFSDGLIHEAFISLDGLAPELGGSEERAREHFRRAVELSAGRSATAYVALARGVAVRNQDREEFLALLEKALEVDPDAWPARRLANLIVQKRAAALVERVDEFVLPPLEEDVGEEPDGEESP